MIQLYSIDMTNYRARRTMLVVVLLLLLGVPLSGAVFDFPTLEEVVGYKTAPV